jgi:hypothetical protein
VAAAAPPAHARRVVVAGGGPAGLECARRLAERGHRVELHEASDALGGMLRLAEGANPDLVGLADWLVATVTDAGVDVRLSSPVEPDAVDGEVLVWAVGAPWPGLDGALPHGAVDAVLGNGAAALAIARHLAPTTLVAGGAVVAPELGLPGRYRAVHDARTDGVTIVLGDATVDGRIVDARRGTPAPPPAVRDGVELHIIGDASGTAGLADALRAAAEVASLI